MRIDASMSQSTSPGSAPVTGSPGARSAPITPSSPVNTHPIVTQDRHKDFRDRWPDWMKQLPRFSFPPPNPGFELIDSAGLDELLKGKDPEAIKTIKDDLHFMDHELMRLFRERDYEASRQQNRYRLYQIGYILLATLATLIGSFQALALNSAPRLLPAFAFGETLVALAATFLSSISGRESPFELWMINRRRAESLRREYFRYLINLPPYNQLEGFNKRRMLSRRAADINRGVFPTEDADPAMKE